MNSRSPVRRDGIIVVKADVNSPASMLRVLLQLPKDEKHALFFISGSTYLNDKQRLVRRRHIKTRLTRMKCPYQVNWMSGPAMVGWWTYSHGPEEYWMRQKEWFDRNALEGNYPEVTDDRPSKRNEGF